MQKDEDSIIYQTYSAHKANKSVQYIQYKTSYTNISLCLSIGKKADIALLADFLYDKKCTLEETIFRIEGWDLSNVCLA